MYSNQLLKVSHQILTVIPLETGHSSERPLIKISRNSGLPCEETAHYDNLDSDNDFDIPQFPDMTTDVKI